MQNQYTQAVENLQATFNKWFEDIAFNEKQLDARKEEGKPYSFIEVNINYSKLRINACIELIQQSNAYINFLHQKIEALQKNNKYNEEDNLLYEENNNRRNRVLIGEIPQSPQTLHNELVQYLIFISEQIEELKLTQTLTPF